MQDSNSGLIQSAFTPSEAVLIHGELFTKPDPASKVKEWSLLLDGKTKVSRVYLSCNFILAAILANVDAGVIELGIAEDENSKNKNLACYPTGLKVKWPDYTLESRLTLEERISVSGLVENWVIEESYDPGERAVELGKIMLVIRGYAVLNYSKWGFKQYSFANDKVVELAAGAAAKASVLVDQFRQNKPGQYDLLMNDIGAAMQNLTHVRTQNDPFQPADPWLAELPEDVKRYNTKPKNTSKSTYLVLLLFSILLDGILYLVYKNYDYSSLVDSIYISCAISLISRSSKSRF